MKNSTIIILSVLISTTTTVTGFAFQSKSHDSSSLRGSLFTESSLPMSSQSESSGVIPPTEHTQRRRNFLKDALALGGAVVTSALTAPSAATADEGAPADVYFGVGCFWHIQHEFVEAERNILKRSDAELSSRTGYAGGLKADKEGRVCYHNLSGVADYGKLGHGEVVGMTIPENRIGDFATEYFNLFSDKGERVDPQDRGPEYRSLLGLPSGANHASYPAVKAAAEAKGMTLALGEGNDPDTLGKKLVYVMDTAKFPFYQGEVYHQFHDDFQSPAYGKKYNSLANQAFDDGRLKVTGCPDRV